MSQGHHFDNERCLLCGLLASDPGFIGGECPGGSLPAMREEMTKLRAEVERLREIERDAKDFADCLDSRQKQIERGVYVTGDELRGGCDLLDVIVNLRTVNADLRDRLSLRRKVFTDEARACRCYDCGLAYTSERWCDVVLSDADWLEISPNGDAGGLLCFNCMAARLTKRGRSNVGFFMGSGPFAKDPQEDGRQP